ncbi:MAG: hypothetical protein AAF399_08370 [Bacteroidota bacterium]
MIKIPHIPLAPQPETEEAYPICPSCRQRMSGYGQIGSIGDQFDLVDGMRIHNFVCFDCLEGKVILSQSPA